MARDPLAAVGLTATPQIQPILGHSDQVRNNADGYVFAKQTSCSGQSRHLDRYRALSGPAVSGHRFPMPDRRSRCRHPVGRQEPCTAGLPETVPAQAPTYWPPTPHQ
jgi:hypothetical protein